MKNIFSRKRPFHLGKYPMEKVKRVDSTTTKITNDIPRVPKRANFFSRAAFGDLGNKAAEGVRNFVTKSPYSRAMLPLMGSQIPLHNGKIAEEKRELPKDPTEITNELKAFSYFLGSDITGACEVPEYAWYSHDNKGDEIKNTHKYALVFLIDQGFETLEAASGDDMISGAQSMQAYLQGSTVACAVADFIRQMGYEAQAHTNADSDVLHVPLVMLAGLGELSRIGEVVLNPFIGPRFKSSIVTTNLPLQPDKPIDFNLQHFCELCRKCARECPAGAISYGDKVMFNGYEMWKPDVEACTKYRVTNPKGSGCGRCMKVCPFNKQGLLTHKIGRWFAMNMPSSHRFLIWLDDFLEYGKRFTPWKWWADVLLRKDKMEYVEKVNSRDIRPNKKPPKKQDIAVYTADMNPPADSKKTEKLPKKDGIIRGKELERVKSKN